MIQRTWTGRALLALLVLQSFSACTQTAKSGTPTLQPGPIVAGGGPGAHPTQGGEVSGGADSMYMAEALFRSKDPEASIRICYEATQDFGVPSAELESILRWSFKEWGDYIQKKDLLYASWNGGYAIVSKVSDVKSGCKGDEDLKVYFGVTNAQVEAFKPRFIDPYAFSAFTEQSEDKKWKKGLLWIARPGSVVPAEKIPVWNKKPSMPGYPEYGALKYTVLHEIGHIFGNGHVDSTIMTSRIGQWLEGWTRPPGERSWDVPEKELLIDQDIELIPNLTLAQEFVLSSKYGCIPTPQGRACPDEEALKKAFHKIFGIEAQGELRATAKRAELPNRRLHGRPDEVDRGTGEVTLEFVDDSRVYTARITTTAILTNSRGVSTPLFNGQYGNHYSNFGASLQGKLETTGRKPMPVIVSYNTNGYFTVMELEGEGLNYPLLSTREY